MMYMFIRDFKCIKKQQVPQHINTAGPDHVFQEVEKVQTLVIKVEYTYLLNSV